LKSIFFVIVLILLVVPPAFGQLISDRTGFTKNFTIETDGYNFDVEITSNFDVTDLEFNKDDKRLTFFLKSSIQNNLAEIQIPRNLINGNFTILLNDQELSPKVKGNEKISFITVEFDGIGLNRLDIIGTTYLPEFEFASIILGISLLGIIFLKRINKLKLE